MMKSSYPHRVDLMFTTKTDEIKCVQLGKGQSLFVGAYDLDRQIDPTDSYPAKIVTSTNKKLLAHTKNNLLRLDNDELRLINGNRGIAFGVLYFDSNAVRLGCAIGCADAKVRAVSYSGNITEVVIPKKNEAQIADFIINPYNVTHIEIKYDGLKQVNIEFPQCNDKANLEKLLLFDKQKFDNELTKLVGANKDEVWTFPERGDSILYTPKKKMPPSGYKLYVSIWPAWWDNGASWKFIRDVYDLINKGEEGCQHLKIYNPNRTARNKAKFMASEMINGTNAKMLNKDITIYLGDEPKAAFIAYQKILQSYKTFINSLDESSSIQPFPPFADFNPYPDASIALRYGVYHGGYYIDGKFDDSYSPMDPFNGRTNPLDLDMLSMGIKRK